MQLKTKYVNHIITNNKYIHNYIHNKEKKEILENENNNKINLTINNISKWKTMQYLDKTEENKSKKRY